MNAVLFLFVIPLCNKLIILYCFIAVFLITICFLYVKHFVKKEAI